MNTNNNPIIVGLDVGTTKIVALAGRKNQYGKIEVIGKGKAISSGVENGTVMNIKYCSEAIKTALIDCKSKYPELDIKDVYVGIAGKHIRSYQNQAELVRTKEKEDTLIDQSDIKSLVEMVKTNTLPDGEVLIDVVPQEFVIDNEQITSEPIGTTGTRLLGNFHVITGARNDVKKIKMCLDLAKLNIKDLVLQPLASAASVLSQEDFENGVCMVDIGGGTTDIAVFYDKVLYYTAVIGKAGVDITKEIKDICEMTYQNAELLKVNYGSAIPEENLSNTYIKVNGPAGTPSKSISKYNLSKIIEGSMIPIFEEIKQHLDILGLSRKLKSGIILTGGGSQLKNVVQLCEFVTKMNTRIGLPNEHMTGSVEEELNNPMYATCVGLILRGYEDYENNLVQNDNVYREKKDLTENKKEETPQPSVDRSKEKKTVNPFENLFARRKKEDKNAKKEIRIDNNVDNTEPEEAMELNEAKAPESIVKTNNKNHVTRIMNIAKDKFIKFFEDETEDEELK